MQIESESNPGTVRTPVTRRLSKISQSEKDDNYISLDLASDQMNISQSITENNSQKGIVVKKKRIHKKKMKEVMYGFKVILKQSSLNLYEQQQQLEQFVFRQIPTQKVYFVAGDILVELQGNTDLDSCVIFNEFRNIIQVEKTPQALSFEVESVRPLKYLSEIIYYLESSQDQQSYEFAQNLKIHQQTVYLLQDQISQLKQNYLSSSIDLSQIIKERKTFIMQQKKNFINELVQQDEFFCVGTLSISYENNTSTLSGMSIGRPTMALIGADEELIAIHFLRQGFIKIFNTQSRRKIFSSHIQFQSKRQEDLEIQIPNFEITTMDNLKIVCDCKLRARQIEFPQHLKFQGDNVKMLNNFEQLIYIKYYITPQHLEKIIKIRSEYSQESPQCKAFPENYDYKDQEIENFEYNMECQIFLERYYKDMIDQMEERKLKNEQKEQYLKSKKDQEQQYQQQQPCGFRYIQ